ncbi:MAG: LPP20 family lipoprotein [Helicobacteraceae bacterium]|nr:LPP20 family lipoprotein [Candidatus Sulfurimonas ponti]
MKYSMLLVAFLSASTLMAETVVVDTDKIKVAETKVILEYPKQDEKLDALASQLTALENKLGEVSQKAQESEEPLLERNKQMLISVMGQGVAPMNTSSPAQAYALAKRAAVADAYRLIAEKVKGVRVDGQDVIQNMMVKRSTVRTSVNAMVRNANVVETTFKEGLCEVEMEIVLAYSQFAQ